MLSKAFPVAPAASESRFKSRYKDIVLKNQKIERAFGSFCLKVSLLLVNRKSTIMKAMINRIAIIDLLLNCTFN